jgi:hypothetical protein
MPGDMLIPGCLDAADLLFTELFEAGHDGPATLFQCDCEVTMGDLSSAGGSVSREAHVHVHLERIIRQQRHGAVHA